MSENSSSLGGNEDLRELEQYMYIVYESETRSTVVPVSNEHAMRSVDPEVRMELSLSLTARPLENRTSSPTRRLHSSAAGFRAPRDRVPRHVNDIGLNRHRHQRTSSSVLPRADTIQQREFVEEVRAPMGTHRFQVYRHVNVPLSASPRQEPRRMYRSPRDNGYTRSRSHHPRHVNSNLVSIGRRANLMNPRHVDSTGRHNILHERSFSHSLGRTHQATGSYLRTNVSHAPRLELHSRIHARHSRGNIPPIISRPLTGDPVAEAMTRHRRNFSRSLVGRDIYFTSWPFSRHQRSSHLTLPRLPGLDNNDTFEDMYPRNQNINRRSIHSRFFHPMSRGIRRARVRAVSPVIDLQHFRVRIPPNPHRPEQQRNVIENIMSYSPTLSGYRQFHQDG